jgi:hypothetical protein
MDFLQKNKGTKQNDIGKRTNFEEVRKQPPHRAKMRILIWRLIQPQNQPVIMDLTGCVSNIALCLK